MTIGTTTEHGEPSPEPERDDPTLQAQAVTGLTTPADAGLQVHATATIMQLPQKHPRLARDIRDTLRARHHMLLLWALRSAAPEGVDHANWDVTLNHGIRALFSTTA